ncbi:uncharacterized protein IL334_000584 [Kwoniella shivajii]|uniref:RNase III domain-containing protein n=1 Tax=Kwoniella shivajii TaxID=564305 RepID=A0ABZ1CPT4_9TREE|nr:hypothetical protein IL334_000584 [Kwoniella shivajii]
MSSYRTSMYGDRLESLPPPPPDSNSGTEIDTPWIPLSMHKRPQRISKWPQASRLEINRPFEGPSAPRVFPSLTSSSYLPSDPSRQSHMLQAASDMALSPPQVDTCSEDLSRSSVNTPFFPPASITTDRSVKAERMTPRLGTVELSPFLPQHPHLSVTAGRRMHPPPISQRPSPSLLGKRKAGSELEYIPSNLEVASSSSTLNQVKVEGRTPSIDVPDIKADVKPNIPVPILPIPLPSKRFKKKPTSKAVLIPVEQLPVFALPPMPTIDDPDLLKQVFTHQSLFERSRGRFEDPIDNPSKHYEKLEHVGDSILGVIVTTWLHETKPRLTIGTATKLKAHLVSNATLSHISGLYNLPQRINGHPELLPVLRAQTDVRAALMEAYIAALYFSFPIEDRLGEGIQIIDNWLREMYEPLYDFFYNYMKKEWEQHHSTVGSTIDGKVLLETDAEIARIDHASIGMSSLVSMYASNQDRELRWEEEKLETNIGILWKIKCTVDGIELGEAIRPFRKAAKNVAGWEAAKKLGLTEE